jgi:hypothetical protein
MSTPEWVRVRLPETDTEETLSRGFFEGLPEGAVELLDAPATNLRGEPLRPTRKDGRPIKPRTTVSKEAEKKADSSPATGNNPVDVVDTPEEDSK